MASDIPIVSIPVDFLGLPFRILYIELVKPKRGTTMETIGKDYGLEFRAHSRVL